MHAAVQSGGRSPNQLNGPSQPIKSGSDNVQNSASSVTSHGKGRKREKVEQNLDSIKRDRAPKPEDADSCNYRSDSAIKGEISKITDRGGLIDTEGVEKFLNLMQSEKKIDSHAQVLLAEVIASTDRFECLLRFVQLNGVLVLGDWLQDARKGKSGDGTSPKESDKSVEELLLALLRALDKLPVNLQVLQTSSIGKSVNNLRQHKNSEIQKKARHLVDTWKKRVDAEMAKSNGSGQAVSWSGKSGAVDNSHGVNQCTGSAETAVKGPNTQTGSGKSLAAKPGHVDTGKPSVVPSGPSKLALPITAAVQDALIKPSGTSGPSDMQLAAIKEEKSSGSSQSQTNSQSCSSEYAKNGGTSQREDARSSPAGSIASGKGSRVISRHRKPSNGFLGTSSTGAHKPAYVKSSSVPSRNISYDKVPSSGTQCERLSDSLDVETGSNQRLIVRLPNHGRSPARCTTSVPHEELSVIISRASSPVSSDKHEPNDHKSKIKGDSSKTNLNADVNVEAFHMNYERTTALEDMCPPRSLDEEPRFTGDNGNLDSASKTLAPAREKEHVSAEHKSSSLHNPSLDSMNALIESCIPKSEVSGSLSTGDDLGMNLLASVATGEMPKSECLSPASPEKSSSVHDHYTQGPGAKSRSYDNVAGVSITEEKLSVIQTSIDIQVDMKKTGIHNLKSVVGNEEGSIETKEKTNAVSTDVQDHNLVCTEVEKMDLEVSGKRKAAGDSEDSTSNVRQKTHGPSFNENRSVDSANVKTAEANMLTPELVCSSFVETSEFVGASPTKMPGKNKSEEIHSCSTRNVNADKSVQTKEDLGAPVTVGSHATSPAGIIDSGLEEKAGNIVPNPIIEPTSNDLDQNKEIAGHQSNGLAVCSVPVVVPTKDSEQHVSCGLKADDNVEVTASTEAVSLPKPEVSDGATKCIFDLNEGIDNDEGNAGETPLGAPFGCPAVRMPSFLPFPVSHVSSGSPVPITVAAPAKGPFVPPENLLKSKGEPGWKGSAATSAFRPAEPRKVPEMPLNASEVSDTASVKQSRPPLEFDLNVPDDRVLHDIASISVATNAVSRSVTVDNCEAQGRNGGLDLDLNRVDEEADCGSLLSTSLGRRGELSNLAGKLVPGGFSNADATSSRGFDLNNGPGMDEVGAETALYGQYPRSNVAPFLPPMGGLGMNGSDLGNLWFPPGNSYSAVAIPPYLPDRSDHSYPIVAPGAPRNLVSSTGGGSFGNDFYRGHVLSSSPAMAFSPYANFPFGPSFPLPSTSFSGVPAGYVDSSSGGAACFPPVPSQLTGVTGPSNASSPAYVRPILINIPESSASGAGSESRKWGMQSLDLNAGPVGADAESRDERMVASARQHFVASSQPFTDDPARLFQMAGAGLKRNAPEGGYDSDRFSYKQPSRP